VDDAVVSAAEHHEIVDIGSAAVQPMPDMVYLAPEWGSVAAGMGAAAVTGGDGFALRGGDTPLLPANVQRLTVPAQDDGGDLRVAEHAA